MAKDRSYKYGWHPDRPQDGERRLRGGDDVTAPEGSVDGWVTTRGFMEATGIRRSDAGRAARVGAIRGEKRGSRWYIAPEEVEAWAALTANAKAEIEAEGRAVAGFCLSIDEDLRNEDSIDAPRYQRVGYRASAFPIYHWTTEPPAIGSEQSLEPREPSMLCVQYREGLKFTSRRWLTDEELDLHVLHRRAAIDRDRSLDEG